MATKKDYAAIAKILNKTPHITICRYHSVVIKTVEAITSDLTRYFKQNNPRFNADKFNKTVYGEYYE